MIGGNSSEVSVGILQWGREKEYGKGEREDSYQNKRQGTLCESRNSDFFVQDHEKDLALLQRVHIIDFFTVHVFEVTFIRLFTF